MTYLNLNSKYCYTVYLSVREIWPLHACMLANWCADHHPLCEVSSSNFMTIIYYMKNIFQKVFICLLTHLNGQNNRAVCKRYGLSWRCIQYCKVLGGRLGRPRLPSMSLLSQYWINVQADRECHHCTRKLGLQASSEARGSVTVLCHTCLTDYTSQSIMRAHAV